MKGGLVFFAEIFLTSASLVYAAAPQELQNAINERTKALEEVTSQIAATQKNLIDVEAKSTSLKQELGRIDYSIKQINLGIKSSEISIEKLGLEISSLQYDISEAERQAELKKNAVAELMRSIQRNENESPLITFLKKKSLAESMVEVQNLIDANNSLAVEVKKLAAVSEELNGKLDQSSDKKVSLENERRTLKTRKSLVVDQKNDRQALLAQTKSQEKLYQQQMNELEKRQLAISSEIEQIEDELRAKIDPSLLPQKRPGVLALPVTGGRFSQSFGATAFARNGGYKGKFHNGLDIAAPVGTPIYAAEDGRVVKIGDQDKYCHKGAYGKYAVIKHDNNLVTLYAHMSLVGPVSENQVVKRGQLIGYVGKTGYATGPHLHLTVYSAPTFYMGSSRSCGPMPYGGYLNPMDYLQI